MLNLKNDVSNLEKLFAIKQQVVLYGAGASTKLFCNLIMPAYRKIV